MVGTCNLLKSQIWTIAIGNELLFNIVLDGTLDSKIFVLSIDPLTVEDDIITILF